MYHPNVLDGIPLSDTSAMAQHPIRSRDLQYILLQSLSGMDWKSSFRIQVDLRVDLEYADRVDGRTSHSENIRRKPFT